MRNTVPTFPCLDLVATACDVNMFIFTISSVKKNLRTQNFRQRICKIWPQLHDALSAIIGRLFFLMGMKMLAKMNNVLRYCDVSQHITFLFLGLLFGYYRLRKRNIINQSFSSSGGVNFLS